ncbi:MAG: AraC family transcriptional regulator [Clostridiales Family XIII bacterium]|jgi:AraC-like DNA-binding protein/mannose-6-phosphate isomerase-like protein (cupin superfamily)|nr:AraC family transcriptional regulator [Clostridiales Family XIII bacterium]
MPNRTENKQAIYQKQITRLPLGTYDFVIQYAEMLNETTAEFRHSHPYMELFYIQNGDLTIRYDDEEVCLTTGDLMIVSEDTPHHVLNIPGEKKDYFILIFELKPVKSNLTRNAADFREAHEMEAILKKIRKDKYTYVSAGWDAGDILEQISTETYEKRFGWTMYANMLYYGFFIRALRYIVSEADEPTPSDDSLNLAIEATKYIHAHYSENISLETLAAYLYISPRHVNRMFKKMFGTTFGKTLRTLRLTYAKNLLSASGHSADDIAERVGFSSAQAMRKIFKEYEGMTISQYKNKIPAPPR